MCPLAGFPVCELINELCGKARDFGTADVALEAVA